jgi:hypothetical protein
VSDFLQFVFSIEQAHFSASLLVFIGMLAMQMAGVLGDVSGIEVGSAESEFQSSVGKGAPLFVLLMPFLAIFGCSGIVISWVVRNTSPMHLILQISLSTFLAWSLALFCARQLGSLVAAWLPGVESYHVNKHSLVGQQGKVISATMESNHVSRFTVSHATAGHLTLKGRLSSCQSEVQHDSLVVITEYDKHSDIFLCESVD